MTCLFYILKMYNAFHCVMCCACLPCYIFMHFCNNYKRNIIGNDFYSWDFITFKSVKLNFLHFLKKPKLNFSYRKCKINSNVCAPAHFCLLINMNCTVILFTNMPLAVTNTMNTKVLSWKIIDIRGNKILKSVLGIGLQYLMR